MRLTRLILLEISYRKFNFLFGVVSVALAVSCLVGSVLVLRGYDEATETLLQQRQADNKARWAAYEDEMRVLMKELGFNLMILHEEHNLAMPDQQTKYLSESYVDKLLDAKLMLINHVLPFLEQKVWWKERDRWVTLVGTTGEVFIKQQWQKPIFNEVPGGRIVLGYEIHKNLKLKKGDKVELLGQDFIVHACLPAKGFREDEKIWISLDQAQTLLDKEGRVTGILALQCHCSAPDAAELRATIEGILPGTQVREHHSHVITRAEGRRRESEKAEHELAELAATRNALQAQRQQVAGLLVPFVVLASAIWLGFLSWSNVRQRQKEIGVLRAVGLRSKDVLCLFLTKAGVAGLLGAGGGCLLGGIVAMVWTRLEPDAVQVQVDLQLLLLALFVAPLLSLAATWIPALLASGQDPVTVLSEE